MPTINSTVHIYPINGACHRVAPDATAFAYRDAKFATVIAGLWPDPADNETNTNGCATTTTLRPHSDAGGYVNFMAGDDQERIEDNYKGNYDRLVDVKRKYDPDNLFHLNQNIKPSCSVPEVGCCLVALIRTVLGGLGPDERLGALVVALGKGPDEPGYRVGREPVVLACVPWFQARASAS